MEEDMALIDDIHLIEAGGIRSKNKTIYMETDPIAFYPEETFKRRYRMSKESFFELCRLLEGDLAPHQNNGRPLSTEKQLLTALRYYATGSFQAVNGDAIGISQQSVSNIVVKVSKSIARLYDQFIIFPTNDNSSDIMNGFYRLLDGGEAKPFPGVIGAIDCTHVEVLARGVPNREVFRNRKGRITTVNHDRMEESHQNYNELSSDWR